VTSPNRAPSSNFAIFVFLFALGMLIHKTQLWEGLSQPLPLATTALCVMLLFRPASARLLLLFAVATLLEATWYAPFYFLNHMVYVAFVCFGIVGAFVSIYWRERRVPSSVHELEAILFPLFRAGLYVMFAFVVLHKSNAGFFDSVVSCALDHFGKLTAQLPWIPSAESLRIEAALPLLAWLAEGSIAVLLFFKRSRQLALYLAFGFHYLMAINGYQGFSAFALSMYVPFMPVGLHKQVAAAYHVARARFHGATLLKTVLVLIALFTVAMTLGHATGRTYQMERVGRWWYLAASPLIFFAYAYLFSRRHPSNTWPAASVPGQVWQLALLVLFATQSFMPYLGLKTESSFSMFSNLRTEEGEWNHLFLPEWVKIGGFQDSLVLVTRADGMTLLRPWERDFIPELVAEGPTLITEFEFKRQISAHCRAGQAPITLSYTTASRTYELADACQDPELSSGNGWVLEKFLWFRPVMRQQQCIH